MYTRRNPILRTIVILAALSLAACGASPSTGQTTGGTPTGNSTSTGNSTPTPQPTAKAAPTMAPVVTQQFCQSAMTVAEANQIMNPPTPATSIQVQSTAGELGVCSYIYSPSQQPIVKILIDYKLYTGPKPVPESTIEQLVAQLAGAPDVTVTTLTPVSGVGDQAEFLAANVSEQNLTLYADAFYVIYGNVAFMCDDFHLNTKPDDPTQLNALKQCAQHVVSVL